MKSWKPQILYRKTARSLSLQEWCKHRKLFSKWRPSAYMNLRKFPFLSRDLYLHVICHPHSIFRVDPPIRRRYIAKKPFSIWCPSAILNLKKNDFFLSNFHARNRNFYLSTKFDRNRLIHCWDMEIKLFFKMAADCHLEFAEIAVFVTWPISACDPSSLLQISRWSADMAPRYSQKTIFNMASVRRLEFCKITDFCFKKPMMGLQIYIWLPNLIEIG